jgi:hypothetical protein
MLFGERPECRICIDVVHDDHPAGAQILPGNLKLERHIAASVHAVVNEHVDPTKLRQKYREPASARTFDVHPTTLQPPAIHRGADLPTSQGINWWQIDAPQIASIVKFKRLQD